MPSRFVAPANGPEIAPPLERKAKDSRRIALMLLVGALPYLATLGNGFIYDDFQQIVENPYVHSFRHLGTLLGSTVWSFQGAEGGLNFYRPLMSILFLFSWSVSGPIPIFYHVVNIVVHAANVAMVYWITRKLWDEINVAVAAAVIFALHPIHAESVAWITGVVDLHLTFFYLLAFGLYLEARRPNAPRLLRLAVLASFAMALLSKEIAVTLPAVVVIYEHFYSRAATSTPEPILDKVSRYAPLWAIAGLYAVVRGLLIGGLPHAVAWRQMNLRETLLSGMSATGLYLAKLIWPARLHLTYAFHKSESLLDTSVLAGMMGLGLCVLLFRLLWRRSKLATFGFVWLVLTIGPVLNIRWMPTPIAERYLYLPSVGFCWLLACGFVWIWRDVSCGSKAARAGLGCALGIVFVLSILRIETRIREWRDQFTFVLHEVAASPNVGRLHDNLGSLYAQKGDLVAAEREWNTALLLDSEDEVAFAQIASLRSQQKRYPESVAMFQRAIHLRPTFAAAHLGLGDAYATTGNYDDAEVEYREAVRLAPVDARARNRLSQLLYDERRWIEAEEELRASISIEPSYEAHDRLGDLALARGDTDAAIRNYLAATTLEPFDGHAHIRLGDLYAVAGRSAEAVREYQDGLATNPNDVHALTALRKLRNGSP